MGTPGQNQKSNLSNSNHMTDFKKIAAKLGSRGGKASVASRFAGKSKEEVSATMAKVRASYGTPEDIANSKEIMRLTLEGLNSQK